MQKFIASSFSLLISFFCGAQDIFLLRDPGNSSLVLAEGWTYHMGDEPDASQINYEAHDWKPIRPAEDIHDSIPVNAKSGVGWMRLRFRVSDGGRGQQLTMMVRQSIASEIYLNGKSVRQYGVVSDDPSQIYAYDPRWEPVEIDISNDSIQVLAVRFAVQPGIRHALYYGTINPFFSVMVMRGEKATEKYKEIYMREWMSGLTRGIMFMVFVVHISFFLMFPVQRANLLFALSALFFLIGSMLHNYYYYTAPPDEKFFSAVLSSTFYGLSQILMLSSINSYLRIRTKASFWMLVTIEIFSIILAALWYSTGFWFVAYTHLFCYFLIFLISSVARKRQIKEATILTIGFGISTVTFFIFLLHNLGTGRDVLLAPQFSTWSFFRLIDILAPPAAVSIFLALDFAKTSNRLQVKLDEVEVLSQKNVAVEREKQELLASQNQQLEAKVQERTAALNHSLIELKSAQSQLIQSEKMASLGELTAGIAHEIQNPLNFINNFSEVNKELLNEMREEIQKENYTGVKILSRDIENNQEKIGHHGKRADAIVKGMLQHSRMSSGTKEPTDINALTDEYLRLAYHGLRAKDKSFNVTLKTDFDKAIGTINVVPQEIGRVILNLINNAFYAVDEKRKQNSHEYEPMVTASTKKSGNTALISIKDNGNGVPQKVLDKIFQPFFTTKPTGQGTGLGLSLSYDIVKAHGGDLRVASKDGEGAEFIIELFV